MKFLKLGMPALVNMLVVSASVLPGCGGPEGDSPPQEPSTQAASQPAREPQDAPKGQPQVNATGSADDVAAAQKLLEQLGPNAKHSLASDGRLTAITVLDGSVLSPADIELFGRLTDLEKLQIYNFRALNDDLAAKLTGLKKLKSLALTNSIISDATVTRIADSFPLLKELDLSYNTNLTNAALKAIARLTNLERLTLVQNRFNDLGTSHLAKLVRLRVLDLRGNMEAGDMTLEVVGQLPKLEVFKHRSSTVSDYGVECLAQSTTLRSLLMQDFGITGQAGQALGQMKSLTELEIFRCQGFTSDGVLALKGMKLSRLKLRDLPAIDDMAMEVFEELPQLKRLELHELASVTDEGLAHLEALQTLEVLDIWAMPQMTDATIDVIVRLPRLKVLSVRTTGVTDAAVDKLLQAKTLQSLTFKDNGGVSDEALKKLAQKKWTKLVID
ncbi:MAG TPA: hypothetical protein EYP14_20200 [Planctomycetaceae bacterium]|nr:hypothetical protein [Planctomycetaceae bacterium]